MPLKQMFFSKRVVLFATVRVVAVATAAAITTLPFPGWRQLADHSPDIVVARCNQTPRRFRVEANGVLSELGNGVIDSEMEVVWTVKGSMTNAPMHMHSLYWPRQGENYLIFGHFHSGFFQAFEEYKIVPVGLHFRTNGIAGKSTEDQIKVMLEYRLSHLNQNIKREEEERRRLEEGIKE